MKKMLFVCLFVGLMPCLLSALPQLSVTKSGSGAGVVTDDGGVIDCGDTCSSGYAADTVVTLAAAAATGSHFVEWTGACTGFGACVVTMDADKTVNAKFDCDNGTINPLDGLCGLNGRGDHYEECIEGAWEEQCDDPDTCTSGATQCDGSNNYNLCEMQLDTGNYDWTVVSCTDEHDCTVDSCDDTLGCVNALADTDTVCAPAAGVCDAVEYCDGTHPDCVFDLKLTIECNAKVGDCDVAENCDGIENDCPIDGVAGNTVVCRDADGDCDAVEKCTGSSKSCPGDGVKGSDIVCRPIAGVCDVADNCDGMNKSCPTDEFAANTVPCRTADGECDVAENCPGNAAACPVDEFVAIDTPCGSGVDVVCNRADTCDGEGTCQPNYSDIETICHVSTGICDPAETCDGAGNCPVDLLAGTDTVCRSAVDVCDADEVCDGANVDCPAEDYTAVNGDECVDGYDYTDTETCADGVCSGAEVVGSCAAAYTVTTLPYTLESTTIGRPSHIDTYGLNCPLSSAPLGDAVLNVAMDSSKDYTISITRTGGWTGFIAVIPMCTEFFTNTTCLNSNSAADSFTYSPAISGNATIVVESNSAEGDFTLTIEEVEVIVPDDTPITDDDTILTDEIATDDIVTDDVVTDDIVTDEILSDEAGDDGDFLPGEFDEPVTDDGTVQDTDTVVADNQTDTDTVVTDTKPDTDTTVTDNETPDEASDALLGDEDNITTDTTGTDTDKPGDDGCGCSVVF